MIKRLHGRKHGTLVANPKRNGRRRRSKSKAKRGLRALFANPRKGKRRSSKRHNPGHGLSHYLKKNARRRSSKRRNPQFNLGIDLVSVGVGSVAAIALTSVGQGIFDKYLKDTIKNEGLRQAAPALIVAAGAFAAHKYVKNAKVKEIAKVTLVLSIYKAIDDGFGAQIKDSVSKMLPGKTSGYFGGAYMPALQGAYIDSDTGGAYMHTAGLLPGAGLYGL